MASDDNDRAEEYFHRGLERFEDDDYDGAIAEFSKSLRFELNHFIALNTSRMYWVMKDKHEKTIWDFSEAIQLEPNIAGFWRNRGNARKDKCDIERAISDFDEALLLDPEAQDTMDDRDDALSLRNGRLH